MKLCAFPKWKVLSHTTTHTEFVLSIFQIIFGKSSGPEFLNEVYTPITYHNKQVHIIEFLPLLVNDLAPFCHIQ